MSDEYNKITRGYGPEADPNDPCESGYLGPITGDGTEDYPDRRELPELKESFVASNFDESSVRGKILASGESNFYDTFQHLINLQDYPARSGINYEFPSGDFEHLRSALATYWGEQTHSISDGSFAVGGMTPKQLSDFVFKNSGVFFTQAETDWAYNKEDGHFPESGLFHFGRSDKKFYKYYDYVQFNESGAYDLFNRDPLRVRVEITDLYSNYSNAAQKDVTIKETKKEDFTIFNPYVHYSPFRSAPNTLDYQYVYINYLADFKISELINVNPYKFKD